MQCYIYIQDTVWNVMHTKVIKLENSLACPEACKCQVENGKGEAHALYYIEPCEVMHYM